MSATATQLKKPRRLRDPKHLRLALFSVAAFIVAATAAGAFVAVRAIDGIKEIGSAADDLEALDYSIAGQIRERTFQISAQSLRYQITGTESYLTRQQESRQALIRYLSDVEGSLVSPQESLLFERLDSQLLRYMDALDATANAASTPPLIALERTTEARDQVIRAAHDLGDARRTAFKETLGNYRLRIRDVQYSLFIGLGTLALALGFLTYLAYYTYVRPLIGRLATAEEAVRQSEELASIGTLASGIAHEIRNPITAMKARMFALSELVEPGSAAHRQSFVIDSELDRMERIVHEFLDFARPAEPVLEPTSAAEFLDDVHASLLPGLQSRNLTFQIGDTADVTLPLDPLQVRQLIANLVRNAADACPPNDGLVVLSSAVQNQHLVISVSDSGHGIPREFQPHLFEPFFSKKKGGTGLGLPISRDIARRHGGSLTFTTSEKNGTTFDASFPLAP